jgi:hypothetical protein
MEKYFACFDRDNDEVHFATAEELTPPVHTESDDIESVSE